MVGEVKSLKTATDTVTFSMRVHFFNTSLKTLLNVSRQRCHFPMKPFSSMSLVGLCVHYCFLSIFISLDMTQHYAALIGLTLNGLLQWDHQARNLSCWRLRITPGRPWFRSDSRKNKRSLTEVIRSH